MGLSNYLPNSRLAQPGVCTSSTRPASPYEGQVIYETDTNRTLVWDNAAWVDPSTGKSGRSGLVKVTPTSVVNGTVDSDGLVSFTTQSSVSVNGCFTSSFTNYLVQVVNITTSGTDNVLCRMRGSGSDATGASDYVYSFRQYTSLNVLGGDYNSATSSAYIIRVNNGGVSSAELVFYQPQIAQRTLVKYDGLYWPFDTDLRHYKGSFAHELANSYDGFTLFMASATFSGKIQVYGYN